MGTVSSLTSPPFHWLSPTHVHLHLRVHLHLHVADELSMIIDETRAR